MRHPRENTVGDERQTGPAGRRPRGGRRGARGVLDTRREARGRVSKAWREVAAEGTRAQHPGRGPAGRGQGAHARGLRGVWPPLLPPARSVEGSAPGMAPRPRPGVRQQDESVSRGGTVCHDRRAQDTGASSEDAEPTVRSRAAVDASRGRGGRAGERGRLRGGDAALAVGR